MVRPFFAVPLLVGGLLGLAGCCALEDRLLYHPTRPARDEPLPEGSPLQDLVLHTADGTAVHARWRPRFGARGAVLYCHGNAGNLEDRGWTVRELREALKLSVLVFDYPGFGRSEGRPSEAGCYAAADAAHDWLVRAQGLAPETVVVYGESLGGAVAVDLASRRPHRALVLVRTFTSVPDVAQAFGALPVRWLVHSSFENLSKLPRCKRPIFLAQADADRLVPFAHGKRLLEAAGPDATFFTLRGSGHNDPPSAAFYAALAHFLAEKG